VSLWWWGYLVLPHVQANNIHHNWLCEWSAREVEVR
jgi:hypothetical protein